MAKKKKRHHRKKHAPLLPQRSATPGAPPGNLEAKLGAKPSKIDVLAYGPEAFVERQSVTVAELKHLKASAPVIWINITGLGDTLLFKELGEIFGLHPLALEDALHGGQRPKLDEYDDHAFMVVREATLADRLALEQLSMFFGLGFVITIQETAGDPLDIIRERIRKNRGRVRKAGADYLAYAIVDAILDHYFPIIEAYSERLEQFENHIVSAHDISCAPDIHFLRHELHVLRRLLSPTREAIGAMAKSDAAHITQETSVFVRDLLDHINQLLDALDSCYDFSSGLMDLHYWQVNQRMNETMRLLTIISTIFIPLSFIASIYGMNFDTSISPFNMPELHWRYGYLMVLGLMFLVAAVLLLFFRQRGWFEEAAAARAARRAAKQTGADFDLS